MNAINGVHLLGSTVAYQVPAQTQAIAEDQDKSIYQQYDKSEDVSSECSDGKDDGKIGFFEKIGNAIKGVFNGVKNGIKGMFTDKEGKFSLFNTIKSVGLVAASIACPAFGAVMCGVGVAKGAVGVIKNAKEASKATTDAEAKAAWQGIGSSGMTAAVSAVGLKASLGAVAASKAAAAGGNAAGAEAASAGFLSKIKGRCGDIRQGIKDVGLKQTITSEAKALRQSVSSKASNIRNDIGEYGIKDYAGMKVRSIRDAAIQRRDAVKTVKGARKGLQEETVNIGPRKYVKRTVKSPKRFRVKVSDMYNDAQARAANFRTALYDSPYINMNPKLNSQSLFTSGSLIMQENEQ